MELDQLQRFASVSNVIVLGGKEITASFKSAANSWRRYSVPRDKYEEFCDKVREAYFHDLPGFSVEDWIAKNCTKL